MGGSATVAHLPQALSGMISAFADVSAVFPWFFPAVAFLFGACIGSFLNVVIHRVPKGESIVFPGSHCACGQPIRWYDNLPIVSWILLRGKARCCGRPFSIRYPLVELLTALLFAACWMMLPPLVALCGAVFLSCLIAATFIDLDHMIIPDTFSIGLGVVGVLLSFWVPALHGQHSGYFLLDAARSGFAGLLGLLIGSSVILWIAILAEAVLKKEAMGFGDVKLLGAIGAFCGWKGALFAIFGGAVVGTVWLSFAWLWLRLTGRESTLAPRAETPEGEPSTLTFGAHVPFGPMLAVAGAAYFLLFHRWMDPWLDEVTSLF